MKHIKLFYGILLILLLHVSISFSSIEEFVDHKIYDAFHKIGITPKQKQPSSTTIVAIDEKSLKYFGQWPWSRVLVAQLVQKLQSYKPTSIGLDILFAEEDKTSPVVMQNFYEKYFGFKTSFQGVPQSFINHDELFGSVLSKSRTTMAVYMQANAQESKSCDISQKNKLQLPFQTKYKGFSVLCNIPLLQKNAANIGFINAKVDSDGVLRSLPLFIEHKNGAIPSFALANIMSIEKPDIKEKSITLFGKEIFINEFSNIHINFFQKKEFITLSAIDVLSGKVNPSLIQGKFVLIGPTATGLFDRYFNTLGEEIPGVFMHANMVENLIQGSMIYGNSTFKTINIIVSFILSFFLLYFLYKKEYIYFVTLFLSFTCIAIGVGAITLFYGIYIFIGYFLTPFVLFSLLLLFLAMISSYKERQEFFHELQNAHSSTIDSMALVAETRDTETGAHIKRTKEYMRCLSDYLLKNGIYTYDFTKNFSALLYKATPLHDIGKVGIADSILKKPEKLTKEEFDTMKKHTQIGGDILDNAMLENKNNAFLKIAKNIAYGHHEKWDGSGYPQGLKGMEIPLEARMMAIADVYDALISRRCYKDSFSYEVAENILFEGSGTHFDPVLIEAFKDLKEDFRTIAEKI